MEWNVTRLSLLSSKTQICNELYTKRSSICTNHPALTFYKRAESSSLSKLDLDLSNPLGLGLVGASLLDSELIGPPLGNILGLVV